MKIAFTDKHDLYTSQWIKYCEENNIEYKLVDIYSTDAVQQIKDCDAFMWHHNHMKWQDLLCAKQILAALECSGVKVWPSHDAGWHFDDKVGESYLFDALELPMVPYYIFYDKKRAYEWAKHTSFPKIFKLRGGGGSVNVKLVKSSGHAKKLIRKAFGKGFSQYNWKFTIFARYKKWQIGHDSLSGVFKGVVQACLRWGKMGELSRMYHREMGYAYFQDFIPDNDRDYRVIVINQKKAFAYYRLMRKNDFRASGGGDFHYGNIPESVIELAFRAAKAMNSESVAFDFLLDKNGDPYIVESSYCFGYDDTDAENGWWTDDLKFHPGSFNPFGWMVDGVISQINAQN